MRKDKRREKKEKKMLSQLTHLSPLIPNPVWNPCKSSLRFSLSKILI